MKTRPKTKEEKYSRFAKEQEACRKDVEQTFWCSSVSLGHIVRHPAKQWSVKQMWEIMIV
jgi:hypothetical protein